MTPPAAKAATGTVYALVDPRDNETRYIGATVKPLTARLDGHFRRPARRVREWISELEVAGLSPLIVPVGENVPVAELPAAEEAEITRIIAAGGSLLNERSTERGQALNSRRIQTEEREAWGRLADAAVTLLGGPLPPGALPVVEIPEATWLFMSRVKPGHRERVDKFRKSLDHWDREGYLRWRDLCSEMDEASESLWLYVRAAWAGVRRAGGEFFDRRLEAHFRKIAELPCDTQENASRLLTLTVWYMVAVDPWRHLAELGGLPLDDASFIAWAGSDPDVREALEFLTGRLDGALGNLAEPRDRSWEDGPGHLLGAVAAAYSDTVPEPVRDRLARVLGQLARDHMLTRPMADLLMRLDPGALDTIFGRDIAGDVDRELGLPAGTSARVLRAIIKRVGYVEDGTIRRAADRAAQALPVATLPDYAGWHGTGIPTARTISGSLARAGLAEPAGKTRDEYLECVRELWVPNLENVTRTRSVV